MDLHFLKCTFNRKRHQIPCPPWLIIMHHYDLDISREVFLSYGQQERTLTIRVTTRASQGHRRDNEVPRGGISFDCSVCAALAPHGMFMEGVDSPTPYGS